MNTLSIATYALRHNNTSYCRYSLINQCWVESPDKRLSFEEIAEALDSRLEDVAGYMDFAVICSAIAVPVA